jgi:tetratricopeptide (TPR) repeat protein
MTWVLLVFVLFAQPDLIVESSLNRPEVYIGQRMIYTVRVLYRIYPASGRIELREPDFALMDLKSHTISRRPDVGYEVRFGEEYRVESFRYLLFPTTPGMIVVPPSRVEFDGEEISGNPVNLVVRPLPEGFHGAVGRWRMRAELSSSRAFVGTRIGYAVEVMGDGDPDLVPDPEIDWPSGVKVERSDEDRSISKVIFRYSIIPQIAGEHVIPPARIPAFDPDSGRTYVARSATLRLTAMEGPGGEFPKPKIPTRLQRKDRPFYIRGWFILLQALPLLSILAALTRRWSHFRFHLAARRALGEIARAEDDPEDVIGAIYRYIGEISGVSSLPSRSETVEALRGLRLPDDLIEEVDELLGECERARFSPEKGIKPEVRDRAAQVVREIASQRAPRWLRRFFTPALLIILSLTLGSGGNSDPYALLREAVKLYESGNYHGALDRYLILAQEYRDGRLYYDIGLTYLRMNDPARAVLWLERARRMMPRDRDLKRAMIYARALKADRFEFTDDLSGPIHILKEVRIEEILGFSLLLYWGTAIALSAYLWMGWRGGRNLVYVLGALLAVSFLALALRVSVERDEGIIMARRAAVRTAPIESAPTLMELHPGTKVRIESQRPGWFKVITPAGEGGWIKKEELNLTSTEKSSIKAERPGLKEETYEVTSVNRPSPAYLDDAYRFSSGADGQGDNQQG